MLTSRQFRRMLIISLSIGALLFLQSGMASAANGSSPADEGMEVLTRGPIHEAFADVSVDEAQPGIIATRSVPDPINEIPPDFRPEGDNVEWIPGYWSWDEDQNDFIWVSGIWRDVPPGRQWVPGYWMPVDGGNQYISGFWTDTNQTETEYLPPPPKPLEAGPSSPSLSPDHVWIAGNWVWFHDRYAWQPGYWLRERPDMIWIPAHYVWSPRGYIFVMGYWDYQLARRGVIFAPRYYAEPIYRNHGYYYTPSIVINIDTIFLSLFIRSNSHHYYFGDYFDDRYQKRGFHPWYSEHATRYGYDPYYRSYRQLKLRNDSQWERKYHQQFQYRHDHKEARPPVIYRPQTNHNFGRSDAPTKQIIGRRLTDVVKSKDQPLRFTRVNSDYRRSVQAQDKKLNTFQVKRREIEREPEQQGRSWKPIQTKQPVQRKTSSSPIKVEPHKASMPQRPQEKSYDNKHSTPKARPGYQTQIRPQASQFQEQKKHTEVLLQAKPQNKQHLRSQEQIKMPYQEQSPKNKYQKQQQQTEVQLQAKPPKKQYQLQREQTQRTEPQYNPREKQYKKHQYQTEEQLPDQQQGKPYQKSQDQREQQPRTKQQGKHDLQLQKRSNN